MTELEALSRLFARWLEELLRDPGTAERLPLAHILTEDNVAAVRALDLYPQYGLAARRRDFQLLDAWMAPRRGAIQ
ncbi:MAG: hypothetical protein ACLP19_05215 [Xanthobacteraceae bacterium]